MKKSSNYTRKQGSQEPRGTSWLERITGAHTNVILLILLVVLTFCLGMILISVVSDPALNERIITGLFGIIGTELGILSTQFKK